MKLTRRAFVGKLPFAVAGLWAVIKGMGRLTERHDGLGPDEGGEFEEALQASIDAGRNIRVYYCSPSGNDANDGLSPESPTTFAGALGLVEVDDSIRWFGPDGSSTGYERMA